jgi:hypothetical protein
MTLYKLYQQVAGLEESEERPIVKLDPATIELGQVSYVHPVLLVLKFSLKNNIKTVISAP